MRGATPVELCPITHLQQVYEDVDTWWKKHVHADHGKKWYQDAIHYWKGVDATVDGVLGGFGSVSQVDTSESRAFLHHVLESQRKRTHERGGRTRAIDCGAGVGRITEQLLVHVFDDVDLLEPLPHFLDKAKENLARAGAWDDGQQQQGTMRSDGHRVNHFFQMGMQDFVPEEKAYDCIWIQWCLGHLDDQACVEFLQRCKKGLKDGGLVIVKENISSKGIILDREDSSVTRPHSCWLRLFKQSGLTLVKVENQRQFPRELFEVKMYALKPKC